MARRNLQATATRSSANERFGGLNPEDIISRLCAHFCAGVSVPDLREKVNGELKIQLNREDPWRLLSQAAAQQRLRYVAPVEEVLQSRVATRYPFLDEVRVIPTSTVEDVADHGASMLLRLVNKLFADRAGAKRRVVRIGFGGGRALRRLAKRFAELLSDPKELVGLSHAASRREPPAIIELRAMIGGGFEGSITNPNAYFTYFLHQPTSGVQLRVYGLPTPEVVENDRELSFLRRMKSIASVLARSKDLDIIVSSAGEWDEAEEHNKFREVLVRYAALLDDRQEQKELKKLKAAGDFVGDFLWFPVGASGQQIELPTSFCCMTLLDGIDDVSRLVRERRTDVLLVIGPCNKCGRLKTNVLRALLSSKAKLITRLAIDARTAGSLLGREGGEADSTG